LKLLRFKEGLLLTEYLHIEQDLVQHIEEPLLFTWIVAPTVIYGRHQNAEAEVNEAYCREHGIQVVQRKSGGGCVYADRGNLMISYIDPSTHSEQVFARFLKMIAETLQSLGLPAVTTSHNDVLIEGRKVSGCACFTCPTGTIVHSTLLFDVDIETMMRAITPSSRKLSKHGVASVRQRVVNIRELTDRFTSTEDLQSYVTEHLAARKDD